MQRTGIDSTGEDLSRLRCNRVVRAPESRQRIEQDHDVLSALDKSLGLFQNHVRDLDVTRSSFVKGRADHLRPDHACDHLGYFLGPFVDQQHDDRDLRMILCYRVRDLMHQDRLTRSWRRHYQSALSFADWRHDVDHSHAEIAVFCLESKPFVGILWPQIVERNAILGLLRIITVDALDLEQREVTLPRLGWPHLSAHLIAGSQTEPFYLRRRDVDVVRTR